MHTFKSITETSNGVMYKYGLPDDFETVPSLTEKIFANGNPMIGVRVEIVAIEVQSKFINANPLQNCNASLYC